jgi:hypothetical protein
LWIIHKQTLKNRALLKRGLTKADSSLKGSGAGASWRHQSSCGDLLTCHGSPRNRSATQKRGEQVVTARLLRRWWPLIAAALTMASITLASSRFNTIKVQLDTIEHKIDQLDSRKS